MECDICSKSLGPHTPCHCVVCARTSLYPLRLEHASVLLEKETLSAHVDAMLRSSSSSATAHSSSSQLKGSQESVTIALGASTGGVLVDRNECAKRVDFDRVRDEAELAALRARDVAERAERLRREMEDVRKRIAARRLGVAQKRNDLASATHGLAERRANEREKVRKAVGRVEYKAERVHGDTVKARVSLCREAASLHGLRRARRKARDGTVKDVYYIGFNRIYDLRDLNAALPEMITASLENVARLLVQVSSYLAIRLPAEITLPHRGWPGLTIYSPSSSYHDLDVPFPLPTTSGSSSNSPSTSRTLPTKNLPRPRPLFIDRPLPQLFKEDPKAYNVFVEGVCYLAYDIAWLCRVQGMALDMTKLDEATAVGRNMYHLLFQHIATAGSNAAGPGVGAAVNHSTSNSTTTISTGANANANAAAAPTSDDQTPTKTTRSDASPSPSTTTTTTSATATTTAPHSQTPTHSQAHGHATAFGELSHGTSHRFLALTQDPRGLKVMAPARLLDAVRAALVSEMQSAEWEVVDEREWSGMGDEIREEPVVVGTGGSGGAGGGGRKGREEGRGGGLSTIAERFEKVVEMEGEEGSESEGGKERKEQRPRGVNGWMKVKSRNGEQQPQSPLAGSAQKEAPATS